MVILIVAIAVTWLVLCLAVLIFWSRLQAAGRAYDGIDESAYVDGKDAASPSEAGADEAA
jgi:hypothetical protein